MGLGLGLFGVLSIIRLRSDELGQHEIAYYFAALAIGLIGGLGTADVALSIALMVALVGVLAVADSRLLHGTGLRQVVVLDSAITDEATLVERLELLLDARVTRVTPVRVDLVNDTTTVEVHYAAAARPAMPRGGAPRGSGGHPMSAVDHLPTVSLAELNDAAELLTRTDRKYVIPAGDPTPCCRCGTRVLEIDGRRGWRYESTYLDTLDLDSWTAAAHRRRRRGRCAAGSYPDTGECWLEVKTRGAAASPSRSGSRTATDPIAGVRGDWVRDRLAAARVTTSIRAASSRRCTPATGVRRCWSATPAGRPSTATCAGAPATAAPRSATCWSSRPSRPPRGPGPLDRRLWELGHRPTRISKYGTGLALLPRPAGQPLAPRRARTSQVASPCAPGCSHEAGSGRKRRRRCRPCARWLRRRGHVGRRAGVSTAARTVAAATASGTRAPSTRSPSRSTSPRWRR